MYRNQTYNMRLKSFLVTVTILSRHYTEYYYPVPEPHHI